MILGITGEGFYKDALGVVYKDAMGVVYKTLNSISKRGYHVFVEECVVYKTLNSKISVFIFSNFLKYTRYNRYFFREKMKRAPLGG